MADTLALGASAARRASSTLASPTTVIESCIWLCGGGSVVERHLAKVDVAGSSPVPRSIYPHIGYRISVTRPALRSVEMSDTPVSFFYEGT